MPPRVTPIMTLPNGHPPRGMRHRLNNFSESMLNILTVSGTKHKPSHPAPLLVSRAVVFLSLASFALICTTSMTHLWSAFMRARTTGERQGGSGGSFAPGLSVFDYPTVLVADSEPFKARGADTGVKDAQSSLVSAPLDIEVTHAANFDGDTETVARLIVITMDRDKSLKRLLDSLAKANYGEDVVDLDIWIDRANDKPVDESVLQVCQTMDWRQGTKTIHKRAANAGLYQQWIYTWNITEETTEFAVILEDDLEVSPAFYQWLRVARAAYAQDPDVAAFTLQRSTLRPRQIRGVATGSLDISREHPVFKYRLLGTWGFAPQRDQWVEFRKWFEEKKAKGEKPYVDRLITTDWYKSQEVNGFAPTMWSQWWIKFADEMNYFTVTAHLPDGTTLASNWRESGLHYSKNNPTADFPIFTGNDEQFVMPDNPIMVDWDGRIIPFNSTVSG